MTPLCLFSVVQTNVKCSLVLQTMRENDYGLEVFKFYFNELIVQQCLVHQHYGTCNVPSDFIIFCFCLNSMCCILPVK